MPNNQRFIVNILWLSYVENITKAAKLSIRKTDLKLGLRNLSCLNRFIKIRKDVWVESTVTMSSINYNVMNVMLHT